MLNMFVQCSLVIHRVFSRLVIRTYNNYHNEVNNYAINLIPRGRLIVMILQ